MDQIKIIKPFYVLCDEIQEKTYKFWEVKKEHDHYIINLILLDEDFDGDGDDNFYVNLRAIRELNNILKKLNSIDYTVIEYDGTITIIRYSNKTEGFDVYTIELLNLQNNKTEKFEYHLSKDGDKQSGESIITNSIFVSVDNLLHFLPVFISQYDMLSISYMGNDVDSDYSFLLKWDCNVELQIDSKHKKEIIDISELSDKVVELFDDRYSEIFICSDEFICSNRSIFYK